MNEVKIFENTQFGQIRVIERDGEPWFVGKDVAEILGYSNTKDALLTHVDEDDKRILQRSEIATIENHLPNEVFPVNFVPGDVPNRGLTIINESGLYSLVLRSNLPAAKQFKRWVTSEVLPAIRRSGGYIHAEPSMTPDEIMARAHVIAEDTLRRLEQKNRELTADNSRLIVETQIMAPKADYFDQLVDRNLLTSFRETAKQLGVKEKAFIRWLMNRKYIYRDQKGKLMPYAGKHEDLFEVKECTNEKTAWAGTQTMITPKGRETFRLLTQGMFD